MEDVKELLEVNILTGQKVCFNPCFNGRCKRTPSEPKNITHQLEVSILVLMEDVKEQYSRFET